MVVKVARRGFTARVQLEFLFRSTAPEEPHPEARPAGRLPVPLLLLRHPRARRYILRLTPDGTARVTIPRGGSAAEARQFAERHLGWIERQWQKRAAEAARPRTWTAGGTVLFRGERFVLTTSGDGTAGRVAFADQMVPVVNTGGDLRPAIEAHLWQLAARELPVRVAELAGSQGLRVRRVTVRNQRSRWGSCSRRGTVSLNWRLIQTPAFVGDYLIWHELTHLRELNHSRHFWRELARVCPPYREAERWLKQHRDLLD